MWITPSLRHTHMVLSADPLNTTLPAAARHSTASLCPLRTPPWENCFSLSQKLTSPSEDPQYTIEPDWLTARAVTALSCSRSFWTNACFVAFPCCSLFHTLTVPSAAPVNNSPSTVATTELTASSWALIDSTHLEFSIRHTLIVLSHEAEYKSVLSSLRLRHEMASECLIQRAVRRRRTST